MEVRIADLGCASLTGPRVETAASGLESAPYRAPELMLGDTNHTNSVDLWALGCIIGELCVQTWDLLLTLNTGIKGVLLFHIVPCLSLGADPSRARARKKEQ